MRSRAFGASTLVWSTLLGFAAPAGATDSCPNGGNLVANCGFEAPGGVSGDTSSWTLGDGEELDPSSEQFHSGGFSARIAAADQGGGLSYAASMDTCVKGAEPGALYLFGAWRHLVGKGSLPTCTVSVEELGAPDPEGVEGCLGPLLENHSTPIEPTSESWEELVTKFQAHASILDIRFSVRCEVSEEAAAFHVHFDDLYLIPLDVVFHDDFEFAPDSCNWSASVGGSCEPN